MGVRPRSLFNARLPIAILGGALAASLALPGIASAQANAGSRGGHDHHHHSTGFALNGLVESFADPALSLFTQGGHIGSQSVPDTSETVQLTSHDGGSGNVLGFRSRSRGCDGSHGSLVRHGRSGDLGAAILPGDVVHVQGYVDNSSGSPVLDATCVRVTPYRSMVGVGTVVSTNGTNVLVAPSFFSNGAAMSNVTVDASQATVSLDGSPSTLGSLLPGDTVAIAGEKDGSIMFAAVVLAYSSAPGIATGKVTSVSGNDLNLNGSAGASTVDASAASIYLNGVPDGSVGQVTDGDQVVALGTAGSDPLAASVVLDVNRDDLFPTGYNPGDQNGPTAPIAAGTVKSVSGDTVDVTLANSGDSHHGTVDGSARQGFGTAGDHRGDSVPVDASQATVTLDGSASSVGSLVSGDTVMIVGMRIEHRFIASDVYAYDNAPQVVTGFLRQVSGSTLTLAGDSGVLVDASSATVYLDNAPSSVSQLARRDLVVAVGTLASGTLSATAVFAFGGQQDS